MTRKAETPKPLYPLHHEYGASLKNTLQEVTMLISALETIMAMDTGLHPKVADKIRERLASVKLAMYGDETLR